jgi:hypothetical protein
MSYFHVSLY